MHWVTQKCPNVNWIVKTDDDIVINVYEVDKYIKENHDMKDLAKYHCLVWTRMKILRDPSSKW